MTESSDRKPGASKPAGEGASTPGAGEPVPVSSGQASGNPVANAAPPAPGGPEEARASTEAGPSVPASTSGPAEAAASGDGGPGVPSATASAEAQPGEPAGSALAATLETASSDPSPATQPGSAPSSAPAPAAPRPPGQFARAEGAARRAVLLVGLGMAAYVIGGFVMAGLSVRLGERFGAPSSETGAWLLKWALVRTWLWAILPVFGWGVGRYLEVTPWRFAVTSVLSAEGFGLLLATAGDGIDWVLGSPGDMVMRALTLTGGIGLVGWAVQKGLDAAAAAQAEANVEAEKRKAEYAEFLARAEGKRDGNPSP